MRFVFIFLLILISLGVSHADTENLQNLLSRKDYNKALKLMYQTTPKPKRDSVFYFNTGQLFLEVKNYKRARHNFNKVIAAKSGLQDPAKVFIAQTYIKSNKLTTAYNYIQKNKVSSENQAIYLLWLNTKSELAEKLVNKGIRFNKDNNSISSLKYFKAAYNLTSDKKIADAISLIMANNMNQNQSLRLLKNSYNSASSRREKNLYKRLYYKTLTNLRTQFSPKYGLNLGYVSQQYLDKPAQTTVNKSGPNFQFFYDKLVTKNNIHSAAINSSIDFTQNQVEESDNTYLDIGIDNTLDFKNSQFNIDLSYETFIYQGDLHSNEKSASLSYSTKIGQKFYFGFNIGIEALNHNSSSNSFANYSLSTKELSLIQEYSDKQIRYSLLSTQKEAPIVSFNSQNLAQSYSGIGLGLSFFSPLTDNLNYSIKTYLEKNSFSQSNSVGRNELVLTLSNDLYFQFNSNSNIFISIAYSSFSSDIDRDLSYNTNYNIFTAISGVSFTNLTW